MLGSDPRKAARAKIEVTHQRENKMSDYIVYFFIYAILFMLAVGYAFFLNTGQGRRFVDQYTWASVVIGALLALGAVWFMIPTNSWLKVLVAFGLVGIPMIGRSLLNKNKKFEDR
jgi:NhaP-type Na+/H+ or K+/H+ antiporter